MRGTVRKIRMAGLLTGICFLMVSMAGCGDAKVQVPETQSAENTTDTDGAAQTGNTDNTAPAADADNAAPADDAADADGVDDSVPAGDTDDEDRVCLSILGDSISTFAGWIPENYAVYYPEDGELTDVSQTWWMMAVEEMEMELCVNGSSSGSTCAGDSLSPDDPMNGCSGYRISELSAQYGKTPDIIIVYMGTNDLLKSIPMGSNDGTKLVEAGKVKNFSDGYTLILDELESEYPAAQIYCCTLLPVGLWGADTEQFETCVNGCGLTAADYSQRIRVIAGNRDIPVIDLSECGIRIDNLSEMTSDGVHPTPAGMKCIAETVVEAIQYTWDF